MFIKSSPNPSEGIGVVRGENCSSSSIDFCDFSVIGVISTSFTSFLDPDLAQRLILPDFTLSLLLMLLVNSCFGGVCGVFIADGLELKPESKSIFSPKILSSLKLFKLSSLALLLVVGANPLSRFHSRSSKSNALVRLTLSAGCKSVGGALGGATVTGIGFEPRTASSYRRVKMPLSLRMRGINGRFDNVVVVGDDADLIRMLPRLSLSSFSIAHDFLSPPSGLAIFG